MFLPEKEGKDPRICIERNLLKKADLMAETEEEAVTSY